MIETFTTGQKSLSIRLDAVTLALITEKAKIHKLTLSAYVRQMITVGLSTDTPDDGVPGYPMVHTHPIHHGEPEWNKLLAWILETRFLMRSLIQQFSAPEDPNQPSVLDMAKTEAEKYVDQFLKNRDDKP